MKKQAAILAAVGAFAMAGAQAAEWSDNAISVRAGSKFAEPFGRNDIHKTIINFAHASGYKYGSNFLSVDLLNSDNKDSEAQEAYVVYRHTFDIGKISGKDLKWGYMRGVGATVGFDWNTKNDPGYASRKRMLVVGPTFFMDVPGFLNVGIYLLDESNSPVTAFGAATRVPRYTYKTHPMLGLAWGIPLGSSGFSFEGYTNYIASKGRNEFGGATAPEFNFDGQLMYDVGAATGGPKGTFKVGVEYQYWRNKFGNSYKGPAGQGAFAKTPMVRAEYHF